MIHSWPIRSKTLVKRGGNTSAVSEGVTAAEADYNLIAGINALCW